MNRPEQQLQQAVFDHLCRRGVPRMVAFHPTNEGKRSRLAAWHLKKAGLLPGIPDLIIIHDGKVYALELKTEKGKLTANQEAMLTDLRLAGATASWARGLDEALVILTLWGLLT